MDPAQPPDAASTNRRGPHGDAARGALGRYLEDLAGQPLAARTRQAYASHVSTYVAWLAERPEADAAGGTAAVLADVSAACPARSVSSPGFACLTHSCCSSRGRRDAS
jgi:hypothetical protein